MMKHSTELACSLHKGRAGYLASFLGNSTLSTGTRALLRLRKYKGALLSLGFILLLPATSARAGRIVLSLDGTWQIEESVSASDMPKSFRHTAPVPGLVNLSTPAFQDVDLFDSREAIVHRVSMRLLPESALVDTAGVPRQSRNYFWYAKSFRVPARKEVAILKINKAQFGTAVWLNGKKIGEHAGCFTAGYFSLTESIDWQGENRLLVRIGAHPAVLPESVPAGTDFEKDKWTPGIYDSVSLLLADNPVLESLQVAPRIKSSQLVVQTKIKNYGKARSFKLSHKVAGWKDRRTVAEVPPLQITLQEGEEKEWTQTIQIPQARLWTPEHPFLYLLETSTGGDTLSTRFGMREFSFDTATKRAHLNGKVYFMRGSNIALHRFFEDSKCGALPWNEKWVRKLLVDIPKHMNWNSFRFTIGPVPEMWLDIADEAGLLIQNEFFVWSELPTTYEKYHKQWDAEELIRQFKEWMRDNWNHPSVAIWDANNATLDEVFGEKVIPAVRSLDLSSRPWENSGLNPAVGPDDPVEHNVFLFRPKAASEGPDFQITELERMGGRLVETPLTGHAVILNEYDWLWVNRDGSPTEYTRDLYARFLGPNATPEERFSLQAYLLAGFTEFWRAYRNYAGVLYFVYLISSSPGGYTSDNFRNVETLELEPHFADYVREAFKPLGVYINFWQATLKPDSNHRFTVMMVNDDYERAEGKLILSLEAADGKDVVQSERVFDLPGLGQQTYDLDLHIPGASGKYLLKATARPNGTRYSEPTLCRRKVSIVQESR